MSNEQNKNPETEEVDLIVFFNYIGSVLSRLARFFINIFKSIFSAFIYLFKTLFLNWKIVFLVMIGFGVLGYIAEKFQPKLYSTTMLVEPYFDSKYQLVTNIEYFNALIASDNKEALKRIFKIEDEVVDKVAFFEIEPGPETENDRVLQYEEFIEKMDSTRAKNYPYEQFIENRSIYSGRYYDITAYATKNDIFPKLEDGIISSFTNDYSNKAKQRRDTLLLIQKQNLKEQLKQIDSLQNIYIDVLKEESQKVNSNVDLGGISFTTDKQVTREYELLREEQRIRDQLKSLEEQRITENQYYDVISSFQKVGNRVFPWTQRYSLIFPVLGFILLSFFFFIKNFVEYTINYENK